MAPTRRADSNDPTAAIIASLFEYDNISLHHIPNEFAPATLCAMLVFTFCTGILALELVGNLSYDIRLIRRPGWREPLKVLNRVSYFACRYGAFAFTLSGVLFVNLPAGQRCHSFAILLNVLWVFPMVFVDLIFVQRTLAVCGWRKRVTIPLVTLYLFSISIGLYTVTTFGYGYIIPGSNFCGYQTIVNDRVHDIAYILYVASAVVLDSAVLLLISNGVLEGGLRNLGRLLFTKNEILRRKKAERNAAGFTVKEISVSGLLLRQGILYFVLLWLSRTVFMVLYYALPHSSSMYSIMVAGILATFGPLIAAVLFRQTTQAVKRTSYCHFAPSGVVADRRGVPLPRSIDANATMFSEDRYSGRFSRMSSPLSPLPKLPKTPMSGRPLTVLEMLQEQGLAGSLTPSPSSQRRIVLGDSVEDAHNSLNLTTSDTTAVGVHHNNVNFDSPDVVTPSTTYFHEEEEDRVDSQLHVVVHQDAGGGAGASAGSESNATS